MIGKGGMSERDYRDHFVPNRAVYLTTIGYGTGALLGRGVKRVPAVHWLEELGLAQAIWVLDVEAFGPFLVECDLSGNSLFAGMDRAIAQRVETLYAGLKPPALGRYGEATNRQDEIV
jgi:L(+)-tartrate dehydratase beta subunit